MERERGVRRVLRWFMALAGMAALLGAGHACDRARMNSGEAAAGMQVTLTLYDAAGRPVECMQRGTDGRHRIEYSGSLPADGAASYMLTIESKTE